MMQIELQHLRHFYEVARRSSFTAAAATLHVSQSAVSKAVKHLEERHEVKLFDRSRRGGVHLTPTGERFLLTCTRIFDELGDLQNALSHEDVACTGPLALGASDNVCNYLLPQLLPGFARTHPGVTFRVFSGTSESISGELLAARIDLALFYTEPRQARFDAEPLAFVEFAIVSARQGRRHLRLDDLGALPYVGSRAADYARASPALAMLGEVGVRPRVVLETNNQETQKRLALGGFGYTVVPRFMVDAELERGEACTAATAQPIGASLYLVTRRGRTLSQAAQRFAETARRELPRLV